MTKLKMIFTILLFFLSFSLIAQDLEPINIELPEAMFVGTPTNLSVPNLEKPLGKPRPPFLAPKGTTNLALGKSVSSTDEFPIIGELEMITDGEKNADDGYFVELGPFTQHVTIHESWHWQARSNCRVPQRPF